MLERPQTVRRGTLRKYTSPTRTVGAGKCFSPAAGVEKLCRIFQIDTTSFLTGCTQMTARQADIVKQILGARFIFLSSSIALFFFPHAPVARHIQQIEQPVLKPHQRDEQQSDYTFRKAHINLPFSECGWMRFGGGGLPTLRPF